MEVTSRMRENRMVSRSAAAGSMVLLRNVQQTLPLIPGGSEPLPIAVFGMGQLRTALYPNAMQCWTHTNILDGLCASTLVKPDGLLAHKYRNHALNHPAEPFPWEQLSMEELATNNTAAIVVITRQEDDLRLTMIPEETALLQAVNDAFRRTVLVLNTPGYLELSDEADRCGAIVFMGHAGQEGGAALADLLTGEALFRGHLTQSWPRKAGAFSDANAVRDIYAAGRYFDSFGTELRYDFGYGLTYGTSELTAVSVGVDGTDLIVTAEVTNTGEKWPVSRLIQVYCSRPGDRSPQPKQVFLGFAVTTMLDPGQTENVTVRLPLSALAAFSEESSAFLLEKGYYDIRVGFSGRDTMIVGSLLLNRDQVVSARAPMELPKTENRPGGTPWSYPGEEEDLVAARKQAIRLSGWNLPRTGVKRPGNPHLCRPGEIPVRLEDVKRGANPLELVAGLDDHSLRSLVLEFGFCPTAIPGALGASADLTEQYGIPSMTIAAGPMGLQLTRDIPDEETGAIVSHQYCTAFPAASLLGCSWDTELISAVGTAVGREMAELGVKMWLCPGADLLVDPTQPERSACWSEEPVTAGTFTAALSAGVSRYGAAILRTVSAQQDSVITRRAFEELYAVPFAIAAKNAGAVLLPAGRINGEHFGEDTALSRWLIRRGFRGIFLSDDIRYTREPDRLMLEQSAIPIIRFAAK